MAIPSIATLRTEADDLLQPRVSDGQMEAIIAGALAAYNVGTPIASTTSFQDLVLQSQPLIDQARRDVRAIYLSQFLKFLENLTSGGGGGGAAAPVNNLVALRALTPPTSAVTVLMLGYDTPGDGYGRLFYWDSAGAEADNPPLVVRPDAFTGAGVWKQAI